ncbi:uncharacterized protein LOC121836689 [Ixodes scapularis]|uniref:uncharacterized protein LOC121836689 n=1 Tax=Ixodes scapularis TaxID=6945 RepID=UPI001C381E0E|nr:uncharacterized protein LOC121836689 [Ixodes scapularis]
MIALLDMGARVSLMKAQCAKLLGKEIQGNTGVLRGVGGECMSLGEVRVKIRCDEHEVDETTMRVVGNNVFTGPDVIIGANIIDHPHQVLIRKHGQTALVDERCYPFLRDFHVELEDNRVVLRASETVTVPKNCIQWVTVTTGNKTFEGPHVFSTGGEIDILCQMRGGKTDIPVVGAVDCNVTLKRGQVVSRCQFSPMNPDVPDVYSVLQQVIESEPGKREKRLAPITAEEVNVSPAITEDERRELCQVINEHRTCFAQNMTQLGRTDVVTMKIEEKSGSAPVKRSPYRASWSEREVLRKITDDLKANGLIRDSNSEYSSPVLLVRKKTGEYRMVVDYRRLNAQTVKDSFPLPRVDEVLDQLAGNTLFSVLDMAHGYLQIPMDESSIHKATFTTPDERFEPLRLFFGLANGPPVSQ